MSIGSRTIDTSKLDYHPLTSNVIENVNYLNDGGYTLIDSGELSYFQSSATDNDTVYGGDGVDTVKFSGVRAEYSVVLTSTAFEVTDNQPSRDGTDRLDSVERLGFTDVNLAYDIANNGNAGQVAKLLGAVFGASSLSNKQYVGIGLQLLDSGTSYKDLAAMAMNVAGKSAPTEVVTQLWSNVIRTTPTAADIQPFVDMLANGTSIGDLVVLAADTSLNQTNINLVGLQSSGIEYV